MYEILANLLTKLKNTIEEMEPGDYFNEDIRVISNSILHYYYHNDLRSMKDSYLEQLDENIEICRKAIFNKHGDTNDLSIMQQLSLFIVNLLKAQDLDEVKEYDYIPLLNHRKSDIRAVTYHSLWNIRGEIRNKRVANCLLYNIAENLGFVCEAVWLFAGIFDENDSLFIYAKEFRPPNLYEEQFRKRIDSIKKNNLIPHYLYLMQCDEIKTLKYIEKAI